MALGCGQNFQSTRVIATERMRACTNQMLQSHAWTAQVSPDDIQIANLQSNYRRVDGWEPDPAAIFHGSKPSIDGADKALNAAIIELPITRVVTKVTTVEKQSEEGSREPTERDTDT